MAKPGVVAEACMNTKVTDTRYVVLFDCFNSNPRGSFEDGNRPTVFRTARGDS